MPEGFLAYFADRYPRLLVYVHEVVKDTGLHRESMFTTYFRLPDTWTCSSLLILSLYFPSLSLALLAYSLLPDMPALALDTVLVYPPSRVSGFLLCSFPGSLHALSIISINLQYLHARRHASPIISPPLHASQLICKYLHARRHISPIKSVLQIYITHSNEQTSSCILFSMAIMNNCTLFFPLSSSGCCHICLSIVRYCLWQNTQN